MNFFLNLCGIIMIVALAEAIIKATMPTFPWWGFIALGGVVGLYAPKVLK